MAEEFPEPLHRSYIHVSLETAGQTFTSTIGPISDDEGWILFRAYIGDMRLRRSKPPRPAAAEKQ